MNKENGEAMDILGLQFLSSYSIKFNGYSFKTYTSKLAKYVIKKFRSEALLYKLI